MSRASASRCAASSCALAAALLIPTAASAQAQRVSLHLEGGATGLVGAPQGDLFSVGGNGAARVAVRLAGVVGLHAVAAVHVWPSARDAGTPASAWMFGAGLRLTPKIGNLGTVLLEFEGGGSVNGAEQRALPFVAAGAGLLFRAADVLDVGPVVRVGGILPNAIESVSNSGTGAATYWSAGLSFALHLPEARPETPPSEPAPQEVAAPTEHAAPAEHVAASEHAAPVEHAEHAAQTEHTEHPAPAEHAAPAAHGEHAEHAAPAAHGEHAEHAEHAVPAEHAEHAAPAEHAEHAAPAEHAEHAAPAEHAEHAAPAEHAVGEEAPAEFPATTLAFQAQSATPADAEAYQQSIARLAAYLQAHAEVELVAIEAHTHAHTHERRNERLSNERATAVRGALVAAGVAGERVVATGYGSLCMGAAAERTFVAVARVNGALVEGASFGCAFGRALTPPSLRVRRR